MAELERHKVHQSLIRPHLLMDADGHLVAFSVVIWLAVAFSLLSWWGFAICWVGWRVTLAGLRMMAKKDSFMRQVYERNLRFKPYYPAKSGLYARRRLPRGRWDK
jgi:type IV secretion system protein VirB3